MKKRLTLSIDKEKIIKIKAYSKQRGHSVSKFVEDAIDKLHDEPRSQKLDITKIIGAFGKAPKNFDWKKIKTEYLLKKYIK